MSAHTNDTHAYTATVLSVADITHAIPWLWSVTGIVGATFDTSISVDYCSSLAYPC